MARSYSASTFRQPSPHLPSPRNLRCRCCGNLDRTLELSASSINIPPPRTPHKCRNSTFPQNLLKLRHPLRVRNRKLNPRPRIQRNQIHFAPHPAQQLHRSEEHTSELQSLRHLV